MQRALAGPLALCSLVWFGGSAWAQPAPDDLVHHERVQRHVVGARYDTGARAADFGLGYLHVHEARDWYHGLGGIVWFGYGADVRLLSRRYDAIDGALGYGVAKLAAMADTGGFGLELAAGGGGANGEMRPTAAAGVFFSVILVELGYSYQFPLDFAARPDWLSSHQFSARINVPIASHARREWSEPPPK